ncbi:nucleoside monophosphate kinase [Streptomyces sp. PSKA30]|nr:nucleoside monophosphate kinase [Streptomyces sp. PSKA30]
MRIVLMGPPGGGKGTQHRFLTKELGVPSVHLGDLLRRNITEGTDTGIAVKRYIDQGLLIPDELLIELLRPRLAEPDAERGFLLDGLPRNLAQAELIDEILALDAKSVDVVLDIEIPREEAFKRYAGRRICTRDSSHVSHTTYAPTKRYGICDVCGGRLALRQDDSREIIGMRWEAWESSAPPIIEKYKTEGRVTLISGLGPVLDVTERAVNAIAECLD